MADSFFPGSKGCNFLGGALLAFYPKESTLP